MLMNISKFTHACVVLEKNNQSLVIDPGGWSQDLQIPENVVGIVVTHEHADHFDLANLERILATNSEIYIYTHVDIIAQLGELSDRGVAVSAGQELSVGDFVIKFTGGSHATIHPDYPVCANLGVLVDSGDFYYPGDSFASPYTPVSTLAVPAAAPWLKISEAMDFVKSVRPQKCFPTHNAVLSAEGRSVHYAWLEKACQTVDAEFMVLDD